MEPWQECYITENLSPLVTLTTTNIQLKVILLADRVLGDADTEKLAAVGVRDGGQAESKLLFDLLRTRKNSYKAIGKAAFKTNQSGTFYLLLQGLIKHLLHRSNIELDDEVMDTVLNRKCLTEDELEFFTHKIDNPTLYDDSCRPLKRSLYFPRLISNRIKLNPSVFNQKQQDIFVFSGLDRPALTKLAQPNRTATSKTVIIQKDTSVRFVWLDHSQDWDKLRTLWSEPVHLIHFDKYSSEYILQDSTGQSQLFTSYVPLHQRKISLYVSEDEFLNKLETKTTKKRDTICICDTPGMGKSWLLEHIALEAQQLYPNVVVAVISLQQFVQQTQISVERLSKNLSVGTHILFHYLCSFRLTSKILETALQKNRIKLELCLDGFDEIPKDYVDAAKQLFQSIANNNPNINLIVTSRPHMRNELRNTFKAVAYDILPFSEQTQLEYLVRFWQDFAKQERAVGVQLQKLTTYAKACLNKLRTELTKDEEDIMGIPLQCFMVATINADNAIMYATRDTCTDVMEFVSSSSMYSMFKKYTEIGYSKATRNNDTFSYENEVRDERNEDNNKDTFVSQQRQKLNAFHIWKALELVLPELAEDYFKWKNISDRKPTKLVLACGILQATSIDEDSSSVKFLHRNFAEYLIAEHFADIFTGCYCLTNDLLEKYLHGFFQFILSVESLENSQFMGWFFQTVNVKLDFFKFSNSTVAYFLNACLERKTDFRVPNITALQLQNCLASHDLASKILRACISSTYSNILRLFKDIVKTHTTDMSSSKLLRNLFTFPTMLICNISGFFLDENYLSSCAYLCQAAKISNVVVLEELFNFFKDCFDEDLDDICSKMPLELATPLHFAVKRLDYSLVEFFVKRITVPKRCLLYLCINDGYETIVENIMNICKLLVTTDNSVILDEIKEDFRQVKIGSIMLSSRNLEFIRFAVDHGANIRATYTVNSDVDTVLTKNSYFMCKKQFSELCQYLIKDVKAHDLFRPNLPIWGDPLPTVIRNVDDVTLNQILTLPGVNLNGVDKKGNNLVLSAIRHNDMFNIFKQLVDRGGNLYTKNRKGENALHLAVASINIKIVKNLLSVGFSLDEIDNFGNTPLHHACKTFNVKYTFLKANNKLKYFGNNQHFNQYFLPKYSVFDMVKYLIKQNTNILAVNNHGDNFAHIFVVSKHFDKSELKAILAYLTSQPDGSDLFKTKNNCGRTPLHEWLTSGKELPVPEVIEMLLLCSGEEVDDVDILGNTLLLTVAARQDIFPCMKCYYELFQNFTDADVNEFFNRKTFLAEGFQPTAEFILSTGTPHEHQHRDFGSPMSNAAFIQKMEVIKYFITKGADITTVNNNDDSIAHLLFNSKHHGRDTFLQILDFLISHEQESQLKTMNKSERTPLHELLLTCNVPPDVETIKAVLQISGEDVNYADVDGNTLFLSAARKNNSRRRLECLKEFGANHNVTDKYGKNALHISAMFGIHDSVQFLLSLGISLESKANYDCTPLIVAALFRNINFIEYLIAKNANIFATDADGCNIAHLLLLPKEDDTIILNQRVGYLNSIRQAKKLFKMTNAYGRTPLHEYIHSNTAAWDSEMLELLLQNAHEDINEVDVFGCSMLLSAAANQNSLDCLKRLLKLGANPNMTDKLGNNALHKVAVSGNLELAAYLLSIDVALEQQTNYGVTPLLRAVVFKKLELIKFFIAHHANVFITDKDGDNIVHQAVILKYDERTLLRQMLEYFMSLPEGPELFIMKNNWQRTPLHQWIAQGVSLPHRGTLQLMLRYSKVNINATDIEGDTMLLTAAAKTHGMTCIQSLIEFGADINVTNSDERNLLHISAEFGTLEFVKYFALIGVSLEHQDNYGGTPLLVAAYKHNIDMVKYFLKKGANNNALTNDGNNMAHLLLISRQASKNRLVLTIIDLLDLDEAPELFQMTNKNGRTPLHEYILATNLPLNPEVLRLVLHFFKDDINDTDNLGNTMFLTAATRNDSLSCLKLLSTFGANHNVANNEGNNALHFAVQCVVHTGAKLDVVQYLISKGCCTSHVNKNGFTPLQYAISLKQLSPLQRDISDLIALL